MSNAISKMLPNLFCWNHLKRNFKFWLRKNGAQSNEISVYVQGLVQILRSDEDRVEEIINDVTEKWSQSAVKYFNRCLKSDILGHAAKWAIH